MGIEIFPVTIPQGDSVSNAIDLGNGLFSGFQMSSAFSGNYLMAEVTLDGTDFSRFELFTAIAGDFVRFDPLPYSAVRQMRLRSVASNGSPINQDAERLIQVVARSFGCSVSVTC